MSEPFAGSKNAQFAAALAQSYSFYVAQDEQRAAAMVAALEGAIEFAKHDWFGVGNEKAQRAYSNSQQMLRKARTKLEAKDFVGAQEFGRLGQELLKVAYMRSHG